MSIFKQQPQKSHEQDILSKNLCLDQAFFASYRMHDINYFAFVHQGHRMQS